MSSIEIFKFDKNGDSESYATVKNAWLGAMRVWDILGNKYCGHGASILNIEQMKSIWNLADNMAIPTEERIVLCATFDKCLIKREDIPKVVDAFHKFGGNTNLNEQANVLENLYKEEDCIAVGFHQNDVSCEQWYEYNCLQNKDHYWLFDELEKGEVAE